MNGGLVMRGFKSKPLVKQFLPRKINLALKYIYGSGKFVSIVYDSTITFVDLLLLRRLLQLQLLRAAWTLQNFERGTSQTGRIGEKKAGLQI